MFQLFVVDTEEVILLTYDSYEEAIRVAKRYENLKVIVYVYNANDVLFTRSFPEDKEV